MSVKRGFTMVEVLMAVFVLAVGVTGLVGAISGLIRAESRISERDLIDRIAHEKLDELVATQAWQTEAGGSFDDPRYSDYTWSIEEENVGIENLTGLTFTVDSTNKGSVTISTVVFTAPAATGDGAGTGAAATTGGNN